MEPALPPSLVRFPMHRAKVVAACRFAFAEADVVGMVLTGSFVRGDVDAFSDVDLRVVTEDDALESVLTRREDFARAAGTMVAHFPGDHVGLPNLSIVLYDDLVHVDFLFLPLAEAGKFPGPMGFAVLWERDGRVSSAAQDLPPAEPEPAELLVWMEARMWTWCWYLQSKIMRGELYEAIDGLHFVRERVLVALLAVERGVPAAGFRRVEALIGDRAAVFAETIARPDRAALLAALRATIGLYDELASPLMARYGVPANGPARRVVLAALADGLDWRPTGAAG